MWPQRRQDPQVENHLSRDSLRTRDCLLPQVNVNIFESGFSHPQPSQLTASETCETGLFSITNLIIRCCYKVILTLLLKNQSNFFGCHLCLTLICHAQFLCCRPLPQFVFPHARCVLFYSHAPANKPSSRGRCSGFLQQISFLFICQDCSSIPSNFQSCVPYPRGQRCLHVSTAHRMTSSHGLVIGCSSGMGSCLLVFSTLYKEWVLLGSGRLVLPTYRCYFLQCL